MTPHVLTESIAAGLQLTGAGRVLRTLAGRKHGGYVVAFHSAASDIMVELVEALHPDRVVSLDEIVERHAAGKPTAGLFAITVDDGYRNTVLDYCEVSRAKGWPMTFYLPIRFLDQGTLPFLLVQNLAARLPNALLELPGGAVDLLTDQRRQAYFTALTARMYRRKEAEFMPEVEAIAAYAIGRGLVTSDDVHVVDPPMSWAQVETLSRQDGVSFQSHGVTHQAVACLEPAELRAELTASQEAIRNRTGRAVNHFCYPYGGVESIGAQAPAIVAERFSSAVTMARGRLRGSALHRLPRIPFYDRDRRNIARLKVMTATSAGAQ